MNKFFPWLRDCRYALLLAIVAAATLLMSGCGGSDSYTEPTATRTAPLEGQIQSVLIDADTLKSWVDAGLVNNESGWEKVVILDTSSASAYASGHIPGAQLWSGGAGIERYEGPVLSSNMVLDGPSMDAALQAHGIDGNTTVVFASGANPARIYFMFRYWGFPKERLKVLNGNKGAWTAAGYDLTTVVPSVNPSSFSVRNLQINTDVRASLNEFIIAVENGTAVPLNALVNNTELAGATTGIFDNVGGDYVIFQGSVLGAKHVGNAAFYNADGSIKTVAEVEALLDGFGIDGSLPIITYCRAGNAASNAFMPIDITVGWNVMMYDGSWSQWGSLTNQTGPTFVPDPSYALPALLADWETDVLIENHRLVANGDFFPGPYYNVNFPRMIEKPTFRIMENMLSPYDSGANSLEIEDRKYSELPPVGGGAPGPVSGGGGGGC